MDEKLTSNELTTDQQNQRRTAPKCVYCGEPQQNGRLCNKCHNSPARRERMDPMRYLYKKFTGV